jgi:acetyl esterase
MSLESRVAQAMAALPARAQVRLSGRPPVEVDGQVLDPGVQLILAAAARQGQRPFHQLSVAEARANFSHRVRLASGERPFVSAVNDLTLEGSGGVRLPARHYRPATSVDLPLLVYLHGGGFVVGDLETHDVACRIICREARMHVLAVEYRKAPENPFPAAVEDAEAALAQAFARAPELGATPSRIAIGGDSSGGTLAAVATWLAVRAGKPAPKLTLLIYPGTDRVAEYRSHRLFSEGFAITSKDVAWFDNLYGSGADRTDPRLSPLRSDDLTGLPSTLVVSAGFDPLRDEATAYAEALQLAGNRVEELRFGSLIHGFVGLAGINPTSRLAVEEIARTARTMLDDASASRRRPA